MAVNRGVTLVELLVVLVILAMLAAIALPLIGQSRARAHAVACLANLRQLGGALQAYLGDHDQTMPAMLAGRTDRATDAAVLDVVLADYVSDAKVFACPADSKYARETGTSYYWNVALNGQRAGALNFLNLVEGATRIPVLSDKEGWHPGEKTKVNILYADGHSGRGLDLTTGNGR